MSWRARLTWAATGALVAVVVAGAATTDIIVPASVSPLHASAVAPTRALATAATAASATVATATAALRATPTTHAAATIVPATTTTPVPTTATTRLPTTAAPATTTTAAAPTPAVPPHAIVVVSPPTPFPKVPARFTEKALVADINAALLKLHVHGDVKSVDCDEYPCLVYAAVDDEVSLDDLRSAAKHDGDGAWLRFEHTLSGRMFAVAFVPPAPELQDELGERVRERFSEGLKGYDNE